MFADIYKVNVAAAVEAVPQLRDRARSGCSEFLKRIATQADPEAESAPVTGAERGPG